MNFTIDLAEVEKRSKQNLADPNARQMIEMFEQLSEGRLTPIEGLDPYTARRISTLSTLTPEELSRKAELAIKILSKKDKSPSDYNFLRQLYQDLVANVTGVATLAGSPALLGFVGERLGTAARKAKEEYYRRNPPQMIPMLGPSVIPESESGIERMEKRAYIPPYPTTEVLGATLSEAGKIAGEIPQQIKELGKGIVGQYGQVIKHPIRSFKEQPITTVLMAADIAGLTALARKPAFIAAKKLVSAGKLTKAEAIRILKQQEGFARYSADDLDRLFEEIDQLTSETPSSTPSLGDTLASLSSQSGLGQAQIFNIATSIYRPTGQPVALQEFLRHPNIYRAISGNPQLREAFTDIYNRIRGLPESERQTLTEQLGGVRGAGTAGNVGVGGQAEEIRPTAYNVDDIRMVAEIFQASRSRPTAYNVNDIPSRYWLRPEHQASIEIGDSLTLRRALRDENSEVRRSAIAGLFLLRNDPDALNAIREVVRAVALTDPDVSVRNTAIYALHNIGDLNTLRDMLRIETDTSNFANILTDIAELGDRSIHSEYVNHSDPIIAQVARNIIAIDDLSYNNWVRNFRQRLYPPGTALRATTRIGSREGTAGEVGVAGTGDIQPHPSLSIMSNAIDISNRLNIPQAAGDIAMWISTAPTPNDAIVRISNRTGILFETLNELTDLIDSAWYIAHGVTQ